MQPWVKAGKLRVIGVVQEQHGERARLYRQWRALGWPIYVDSLNQLGLAVVPVPLAVAPDGRILGPVRRPAQLEALLEQPAAKAWSKKAPPPGALAGDALFHKGDLDGAIAAYAKDSSPLASFRRGVALRMRFEGANAKPGDGQAAVDAWHTALAANPRQYIWRRRLEQYGPRLEKPYNFYGWIAQARKEIAARGETPHPLTVEPAGAELLDRSASGEIVLAKFDPQVDVPLDEKGRVDLETIVTRSVHRNSTRLRVRVVLRLKDAYWNNEADPLSLHVNLPKGATLGEPMMIHPQPKKAETNERRVLEFEIQFDGANGELKLPAYVLYSVCDELEGTCRYLRRTFTVPIPAK